MKADVPRRGSEEGYLRTSRGLTFSFISAECRDRGNSETTPREAKILMGLVGHRGCWVQQKSNNELITWGENQDTWVPFVTLCHTTLESHLPSLDLGFPTCKMAQFGDDL